MTEPPAPQRPGSCRDCPIACNAPGNGGHKKKYAAYAALWGLDRHAHGFEDFVAAYHHLCNDIGLDAFETAGAIALAIQSGRVAQTLSAILGAVEEISRGTDLGRILGGGAEAAGRAFGLAPPAQGPRKETGHSEAEDYFLDSVGLCAFAYARLPHSQELWAALEELLAAKYGPAFTGENLWNLAGAAGGLKK